LKNYNSDLSGLPISASQCEKNFSNHDHLTERYLLRIQAITLQFAFLNARILIFRPLLSRTHHILERPYKPAQAYIKTCREASLQLSNLVVAPAFEEASNTYATAFLYVHLLTAGIALCYYV
jgi:hypothetical protein